MKAKVAVLFVTIFLVFQGAGEALGKGANPPENYIKIYKGAEAEFGVDWRFLAAIHKIESNFSKHPQTYAPKNEGVCWTTGPMQISFSVPSEKWRPILLHYKDAIKKAREWEKKNDIPHNHVPPILNPYKAACDDVVNIFVAANYLADLGAKKEASESKLVVAAGHYNGGPQWQKKKSAVRYTQRALRQYKIFCQIYPQEVEQKAIPNLAKDKKIKEVFSVAGIGEVNVLEIQENLRNLFFLARLNGILVLVFLLIFKPTRIVLKNAIKWLPWLLIRSLWGFLFFVDGFGEGVILGVRAAFSIKFPLPFPAWVKIPILVFLFMVKIFLSLVVAILVGLVFGVVFALKEGFSAFFSISTKALKSLSNDLFIWREGFKAAQKARKEAEKKALLAH